MHKSQVFFYLLSFFILGVFTASFFNFSQSVIYILLIAGIGIMTLFGLKNRWSLLIAFMLITFAGGVARFSAISGSVSGGNLKSDFANSVGREVTLTGYIDSEPEIEGNGARFVFRPVNIRGSNNTLYSIHDRDMSTNLVMVTTNAFPKREFGEQLSITGELELPQNFTDFDYVTYLKKDGIRTVLFYPKKIWNSSVDLDWKEKIRVAAYRNIFIVKNKFQNAINLSISEPNAAFINGILLGTRQNIPDDLKDAFSRTGTTHILAISGYNIMIISEAVLLGLVWFFRRKVAFWISVGIIILFVILTGGSASVVRAAVMGLLLSFAHGYGRLYDQKNSIILAGAVMIYHNPLVLVFDIGFQLSFAAVLGLIYLYPQIDRKLYKIPEWGKLKELILMTISAQVAVAPLLVYYFGNFSLISLPTNILILPFVPASMLAGFVSGLVGIIYQPMGQIIGYIAWAITTYQIEIVKYFAHIG